MKDEVQRTKDEVAESVADVVAVVCGRIRRWRWDRVELCLAHRPVPTDTYRRRMEAAGKGNLPAAI